MGIKQYFYTNKVIAKELLAEILARCVVWRGKKQVSGLKKNLPTADEQ